MTQKERLDSLKEINGKIADIQKRSKEDVSSDDLMKMDSEIQNLTKRGNDILDETKKAIADAKLDMADPNASDMLLRHEECSDMMKRFTRLQKGDKFDLDLNKFAQMRSALVSTDDSIIKPKNFRNALTEAKTGVSRLWDSLNFINLSQGDSFELPFAVSGLDVAKTAEGSAYHESVAPVFDSVKCRRAKYTTYFAITEEFEKFTPEMYLAYITAQLQKAIIKEMNKQVITGDGTSDNFVGIIGCIDDEVNKCIKTTDDFTGNLDADLISTAALTYGGDEDFDENPSTFIFNKTTLIDANKIVNAKNGNKVYNIDPKNKTINFIPYITNKNVGAYSAGGYYGVYGDLSAYNVALFSGIEIRRSDEVKFLDGQVVYRASFMAGGVCGTPKALMRIKKGA